MSRRPVLCVHGINDDQRVFDRLRRRLRAEGFEHVEAIDLLPNNGRAPLLELARQVETAAERLRGRSGAEKIDLIGFSMGALVSRVYLQQLEGRARVARFISISGPHRGTALAYLLKHPGIQEMRPDSPLIRALEADPRALEGVEVHAFWTPFDLMIVPAKSSLLAGAKSRTFNVALHPLMLSSKRVLDAVVEVLSAL